MRPLILFDDARAGQIRVFEAPRAVIRADAPGEVPAALAALQAAWVSGGHVAGYFSYELGYCLEPVLRPLLPAVRDVPLLWFGVFGPPAVMDGAAIEAFFAARKTGRGCCGSLHFDWDAAAYGARFARLHDLIGAGDLYQANLTMPGRFGFRGDPLALYGDLRRTAAAAHGAFICDGARHVLSLSPELFFDLADGRLTAKPMKGTAAREADAQDDRAAAEALGRSQKNRAENLMIVDLMRNDLSRLARPGKVTVDALFAVETFPTLHQMVSTVRADIGTDIGIGDIVQALFPCGSITGAPKIRAMQAIRDLEEVPRGIYCGAIGCFGPQKTARFNVAIRTVTLADGVGRFGVGGGIVQDSTAASEYAEAKLKAAFIAAAQAPFGLIETMRFSPGEGLVRIDRHLARMQSSAAFFAIPFDPASARAALNAAVQGRAEALRVRLHLDAVGHFTVQAAPLPQTAARWRFALSPKTVSSRDVLARHKTDRRRLLDGEWARLSREIGCDEVVFLNERGEVTEGSRTNVFVRRDGVLLTPPCDAGILAGCLRAELIATGQAVEATLTQADLAGEVLLGNSLRGLIPAAVV